jgi:DNA-binding NtrC family response regulator
VEYNGRRVALVGIDPGIRSEMSRGLAEMGYGVDEFGAADRFMSLLAMLHLSHHDWLAYDVVVLDSEARGTSCGRFLFDLSMVDPRIATVILCSTVDREAAERLYSEGASVVAERTRAVEHPCLLVERAIQSTRVVPGRAPMM